MFNEYYIIVPCVMQCTTGQKSVFSVKQSCADYLNFRKKKKKTSSQTSQPVLVYGVQALECCCTDLMCNLLCQTKSDVP